jgi:preprotein translocase SecE subunit
VENQEMVKAKNDNPKMVAKAKEAKKIGKKRKLRLPGFLGIAGAYFKNSWHEIKLTKWPSKKHTAAMTLSVIIFTVFIMIFIVAVDYAFNAIFERIIV